MDLNALVGQHARLACRAAEQQDRDLKVRLEAVYDERIGEVRVVAQAIARAVLNLVGNDRTAHSSTPPISAICGAKAMDGIDSRGAVCLANRPPQYVV